MTSCVLLKGHTFRSGGGILASFASHNFDTPREGHVALYIDGAPSGTYSPEPLDFEGRRSVHMVLPHMSNGEHSVEVHLVTTSGAIVSSGGASFFVDDTLTPPPSKASMLLEPHSCPPSSACSTSDGCGRGRCASGACVCSGDAAGDNCEIDLIRVTSYLPRTHPSASPGLCSSSAAWGPLARLLQARLAEAHSLARCADDEGILWVETPQHGLGGDTHILTVALTHALSLNKSLGLVGTWGYSDHAGCQGQRGLQCYFHPYGECQHLFAESREETGEQSIVLREEEPAWMWQRRGVSAHYEANTADNPLGEWSSAGLIRWRAELVGFIMQPKLDLTLRIRDVRAAIGLIKPYVGVHIRHGDACRFTSVLEPTSSFSTLAENCFSDAGGPTRRHADTSSYRPKCKSVADYFAAVSDVCSAYGITRVFLATDDPAAVQEAQNLHPSLHIAHVNMDRSELESDWFIEYRMQAARTSGASVDVQLLADGAVLDLFLLREAEAFVGAFSGHFSRLALELMVGYRGFVPPFVSVDVPYNLNGAMPPYSGPQVSQR